MNDTQKHIIKLREKHSVTELARMIGASEMNVYRWTTGRAKMSEAWSIIINQRLSSAE